MVIRTMYIVHMVLSFELLFYCCVVLSKLAVPTSKLVTHSISASVIYVSAPDAKL